MNEAQHDAACRVEYCKGQLRRLSSELADAERDLKKAQGRLRGAINRDPASWGTLTPLP